MHSSCLTAARGGASGRCLSPPPPPRPQPPHVPPPLLATRRVGRSCPLCRSPVEVEVHQHSASSVPTAASTTPPRRTCRATSRRTAVSTAAPPRSAHTVTRFASVQYKSCCVTTRSVLCRTANTRVSGPAAGILCRFNLLNSLTT